MLNFENGGPGRKVAGCQGSAHKVCEKVVRWYVISCCWSVVLRFADTWQNLSLGEPRCGLTRLTRRYTNVHTFFSLSLCGRTRMRLPSTTVSQKRPLRTPTKHPSSRPLPTATSLPSLLQTHFLTYQKNSCPTKHIYPPPSNHLAALHPLHSRSFAFNGP